jgi:DNA polymerase-3 subunit gamma/tau
MPAYIINLTYFSGKSDQKVTKLSKSSKYLSLARKYRPRFFADLVGQDVLTKILHYSIQTNQLVSSFLFTGIRGIGKTTSARIIAHTVNCTNRKLIANLVAPCGECANCLAFQDQSHPDIIEIDAASYTSVDNIRDVVEKSIYMPVLGAYKIFIIDEVHMLSKSAFNALLKTLEEPPSHVIFILLTTEISKVPITILSRCQKFNLKRFSVNDLVHLLETICTKENIPYEQMALESIAYKSDGSARDATVLLEQAVFLAKQRGADLSLEVVKESLDLNNFKYALDCLRFIITKDANNAIALINELYRDNFDFLNIIQSTIELIALLSKLKLISDYDLGHYKAYQKDIDNLLEVCDLAFLTSLWQIYNKGLQEVSISSNQLISFEMLLIKAIYCALIPTPQDLITNFKPTTTIPKEDVVSIKVKPLPSPIKESVVVVDKKPDESTLFEFIKYIHKEHMFELYHFIMNECEISDFKDGIFKIEAPRPNDDIKLQLNSALNSWSKSEWKIIFTVKDKIYSLQAKLKADAVKDGNFQKITSFFPETQISDVWFNFLIK